jgi:hypothetical protein
VADPGAKLTTTYPLDTSALAGEPSLA